MKIMKLANYEFVSGSKAGFHADEADAIVAVVLDVIDNFGISVESGTFLLCGVKNGEHELDRLISFDFGYGPTKRFYFSEMDSHRMAEKTLELDAKNDHSDESPHGTISYYVDTPLFLSLWTGRGRFTCAFYAGGGRFTDMTYVYCAVAEALTLMREDKVLQRSRDELFYLESRKHTGVYDVKNYVDELFAECELQEIKTCKEWHNYMGIYLPQFFERWK